LLKKEVCNRYNSPITSQVFSTLETLSNTAIQTNQKIVKLASNKDIQF